VCACGRLRVCVSVGDCVYVSRQSVGEGGDEAVRVGGWVPGCGSVAWRGVTLVCPCTIGSRPPKRIKNILFISFLFLFQYPILSF
jgi:hypothetical protein